jgi:hypothetical protein
MQEKYKEGHVGLYEKYKRLNQYVDKLEPAVITMMYKEFKNGSTFYPNVGLFFNEFALIYSSSIHINKKSSQV